MNDPFRTVNARYDQEMVAIAQNRQLTSLSGNKRHFQYPQYRKPQVASNNYKMATSSQNRSTPTSALFGDDGDIADFGSSSQYGYDSSNGPSSSDYMKGPVSDRPTGLRHFSTKVCEKVKQKGLTNYNEVADELVTEFFEKTMMNRIDMSGKHDYEMKNIRRRVYDALNVLLAMNIITKNKKDIRWLGLPASSSQEIVNLENQKAEREKSIKAKLESIHEMILKLVTYKNLVAMNKEYERNNDRPDPHSLLYLPFLIVSTDKEASVDCSVSSDKSEYLFSFDRSFEIHDDLEILKRLGLSCGLDSPNPSAEDIEKAKSFLPDLLKPYVDDILIGNRKLEEDKKLKEQQLAEAENHASQKSCEATERLRIISQKNAVPRNQLYSGTSREISNEQDRNIGSMLGDDKTDNMMRDSQRNPGRLLKNLVPHTRTLIPTTRTTAPPVNTTGKRYYIQKHTQPIMRQREPVRQIIRPYALGVSPGGAPQKYYITPGQNRQPQYFRGSQGVDSRSTSSRSPYTPSQNPQNRVIQQRVVSGQPGQPGTIVRKVIKRIIVPQKSGQQINPNQPRIVHRIVQSAVPQHSNQSEMPMSSRQSDMMQAQQDDGEPQRQNDFDFYDPMTMEDDQLINDVRNDLNFQ